MKKLLHFVEATGTDEVVFPASNVTAINIENDQGIRIWFSNSDGNTNDHRVDVTCTPADSAVEMADYFAEQIAPGNKGGIYSFVEGQALPISGTNAAGAAVSPTINTIAYNVGA
tara:strand:- start:21 stop:362 length:342 start_codon:yes stop_codon:yes gene_type:complete